jgi:DNA-binding CsgD family transcriptional regulator/CheY-like chemotaxis protein
VAVGEGYVFIVTPDDAVRDSLTRLFTRAGHATTHVATGEDALAAVLRTRPSLVVLDPIILLSAERTEPSDRVAGLLIGADDYLAKPFDPDELLARARRLLARSSPPSGNEDAPLTGRELQVLQLLADGLSQDAIAKELFISSKTVSTHIQRVLTKLDVHSRTEAVALAYRERLVRHSAKGA